MKRLSLKFENRIVSRIFLLLGIGLMLSSITAHILTVVQAYREFLYIADAEGKMFLSASGWILFWLPLMMYLAVPQNFSKISTGAAFIIYLLFCAIVGAALSGIFIVYIKADIAQSLLVTAMTFAVMSFWERVTKRQLMSWQCLLLTAAVGGIITLGMFLLFPAKLTDISVTIATIIVFCCVTAYSGFAVEKIITAATPENSAKTAVEGCLSIYLNLVGLVLQTIRFWKR